MATQPRSCAEENQLILTLHRDLHYLRGTFPQSRAGAGLLQMSSAEMDPGHMGVQPDEVTWLAQAALRSYSH